MGRQGDPVRIPGVRGQRCDARIPGRAAQGRQRGARVVRIGDHLRGAVGVAADTDGR